MRLLRKLLIKFVTMVVMVLVMGFVLRHGQRYIMQFTGMPGGAGVLAAAGGPNLSSEESDLMTTVFKSALRLFSGAAKRDELAGELSDKLYAGRAGAGEMAELGIELVKPGAAPAAPPGLTDAPNSPPGTKPVATAPGAPLPNTPAGAQPPKVQPGAKMAAAQPGAKAPATKDAPTASDPSLPIDTTLLAQIWERVKPYSMDLGSVPVVILGMALAHRVRRRKLGGDDFVPAMIAMATPAETETYEMKHAVHALGAEDFELLVALVYQRQGYRVTMSAALSGGKGGDFTLARKAERILVQCKKLSADHRVPVERVRELHEAMTAAGLPRGMYVASCGFTWDARNFAKTKGITLISSRTLDEVLTAAKESPNEDLLAVSTWVPKLMTKVKLTPPLCPTCEASMDELKVSAGSMWLCSQRPDCRGRRCARKNHKPAPATATAPIGEPLAEKPFEATPERKPFPSQPAASQRIPAKTELLPATRVAASKPSPIASKPPEPATERKPFPSQVPASQPAQPKTEFNPAARASTNQPVAKPIAASKPADPASERKPATSQAVVSKPAPSKTTTSTPSSTGARS